MSYETLQEFQTDLRVIENTDDRVADYIQLVYAKAINRFDTGQDEDEYMLNAYVKYWVSMLEFAQIPVNYYWFQTKRNSFEFTNPEHKELDITEECDPDHGAYQYIRQYKNYCAELTVYRLEAGNILIFVINHEDGEDIFIDPDQVERIKSHIQTKIFNL